VSAPPDVLFGTGRPVTVDEFAAGLRAGRFSAVDSARASLAAIEATQPTINAFIRVTADLALAQAARVDEQLAAGTDLGPLMGAPLAVKDLFDVAGVPTTAASRLFEKRVAGRDADVVARLAGRGAVVVGKANMDQFAFGPHQNDYGRTNCPADLTRYAGGSSGGSAAAVAAGLVVAALGTDAGGSVRFPASCCGVVGFKPTFGVIGTAGIFPTFPTLDHVGELAADVSGLRALFAASTPGSVSPANPATVPRLAVLANWPGGCDDDVIRGVTAALTRLEAAGAVLRQDVVVTDLAATVDVLLAIVGPEAAAELTDLLPASGAGVPQALLELLAQGRSEPAVTYVRAQAERAGLRAEVDTALDGTDAIVMPTAAGVAWRWADVDSGSLGASNRGTRFLPLADLTGHPAISIPVPTAGLPVGLQLIGRRGEDARLLDTAAWVEAALRSKP
jgi:aspartyl-tRNA(Asn)/glutamyl-tRNA(Gln) amidotransferase subunit A